MSCRHQTGLRYWSHRLFGTFFNMILEDVTSSEDEDDVPSPTPTELNSPVADLNQTNVIDNVIQPTLPPDCRLFRRRWLMLFIFSLNNFNNAVLWIFLGSISDIVVKYYNVTLDDVNTLANTFNIVYILTGTKSHPFLQMV